MIHLIGFDKNHKLEYRGVCKLKINKISSLLLVEPLDENYKMISALFKWKFLQVKNILFVFAEHNFQDFALIFSTENKGQKVSIHVCKDEDKMDHELLFERFLDPIFGEISKDSNSAIKEMIGKWLKNLDKNMKDKCLKLIKNHRIWDILFPQTTARKRKHFEAEASYANIIKKKPAKNKKIDEIEYTTALDESQFRKVFFKQQNGFGHGLIVFTSADKNECYEYQWSHKKQWYFCLGCRKKCLRITAIVDEEDLIKLEKTSHSCLPQRYDPNNYNDIRIIKKPNYEILENCTLNSKIYLIVFDPNHRNRNQCYEYFWSSKNYFLCSECVVKGKHVRAKLSNKNTEKEFIRLSNANHICESRQYDQQKFYQTHQFLLKPNFDIQVEMKKGIERKTLIIFDQNDATLCYKYFYNTKLGCFYCNGCIRKNKSSVTAKLVTNDDGEEYVILSKTEHSCTLKPYIPQNDREIILRPPDIKYLDTTTKNFPKLFIFDKNDQKLCYLFSSFYGDKINEHYRCLGCTQATSKNKNSDGKRNEAVHAYLFKENDEYFVRMKNGQKHCCQPRIYADYEVEIIKPSDYILYQENGKKNIYLAIYDQKDRSLCYKFYYKPTSKIFTCSPCSKKKIHISPKLHQDSNGNEFFTVKPIKHICKPIKVASIKNSDVKILEKSGLIFDEKKKEKIDESRIVRKPNFELQKSKDGIPDKQLIIFKDNDRKFCYIYTFMEIPKAFRCRKCRILAYLHVEEESGEKYIVLPNSNGHLCEPIKYGENDDIIKSPNFMVFNKSNDKSLWKLVIFTTPEKDLCYEYSFVKRNKIFRYRCPSCNSLKKSVTANLLKTENGEEYIQLGQIKHVCTPKEFILQNFEIKIIPKSGFKLFSNKNGKKNAKLIIFDSQKDGFAFAYFLHRDNYFLCNTCSTTFNTAISAKLYEKENGEKVVELSPNQHKCQSKKFNPEEYE